MFVLPLIACFVLVQGSVIIQEVHQPQPYKFGYTIKDKSSQQYREESGNGVGVVQGSYGFTDHRGIQRQVNYVADKAGFRAQVKTNEPGTASQNSAAVQMISSNDVHSYLSGSRAPVLVQAVPVLSLGYPNGGISGGMYGYNNGLQGGLGYSGLLGAGYGGVVNFGANLIGGSIRGYDSRFNQHLN
ncbi:cuticle protein 16.8-like [Stegodyphus dumicola]|uniref:cuticle protein 16.8-like n=1 Tax=Stegodyphus dumicola TaxID=202533 RepID=UPI0015A8E995|nr:cuticle protein 16.8-like [Stegodyphus dumicola]